MRSDEWYVFICCCACVCVLFLADFVACVLCSGPQCGDCKAFDPSSLAGGGCSGACSASHGSAIVCLVCGQTWGKHSGHSCPSGVRSVSGQRGSFAAAGPPPVASVVGGCKASCSSSHPSATPCLVCGQTWGKHSGHSCPSSHRKAANQRGSFKVEVAKPAQPANVGNHSGHVCVYPQGCSLPKPHTKVNCTSKSNPRWSCCSKFVSDTSPCTAASAPMVSRRTLVVNS